MQLQNNTKIIPIRRGLIEIWCVDGMGVELNVDDDEDAPRCGSATTMARVGMRLVVMRPWEDVGDACNVTLDAGDEIAGAEVVGGG